MWQKNDTSLGCLWTNSKHPFCIYVVFLFTFVHLSVFHCLQNLWVILETFVQHPALLKCRKRGNIVVLKLQSSPTTHSHNHTALNTAGFNGNFDHLWYFHWAFGHKLGTNVMTHRDTQDGATSTGALRWWWVIRELVVNVTYPTMPEVSPSTAVGTRGSLGTAGRNTVRKCPKCQRYSNIDQT